VSAQAPPDSSSKRLAWVAGIATLTVVLGTVVAFSASSGDSSEEVRDERGDTIRGIAILVDPDVSGSWDACGGTGGYADFEAGARLTVTDKSGDIAGTGSVTNIDESMLDQIVEVDWAGDAPIGLDATEDKDAAIQELRTLLEDTEGFACMLYLEAEVEDSTYYSIEISDRGALSYSKDELADQGYVVSVSLGT